MPVAPPLTNAEFGARIGVGQSMASRLRSGNRFPSADVTLNIARAFKVDLKELLGAIAEAEAGNPDRWVMLLYRIAPPPGARTEPVAS